MSELRAFALRPWMAAVLALVLCVAGVGRGWAAIPDGAAAVSPIPGVAMPICHAGDDAGGPDGAAHHDCCDICALCAPVTLGDAPALVVPHRIVHVATHAAALHWAPVLLRPRTPRLAQGPPLA